MNELCPTISDNPCDCSQIIACSNNNIVTLNLIIDDISNIDFSLNAISYLSNLQIIDLGYMKNIHGSLSDLSNLTKLTKLVIAGMKNIHGSLSDLSNLTKLTYLHIEDSSNIKLDISYLSSNINLQYIILWGGISQFITSIKLSDLAKFLQLNVIDIDSSNINGSLNDISGLSLSRIALENATNISGSISDISGPIIEFVIPNTTNINSKLKELNKFKPSENYKGLGNIDLRSSMLDGSCHNFNINAMSLLDKEWCHLRVKDYSNCINYFSNHCTFYP